MALLCYGCDAPRATIRAFCASCAEVTESYRADAPAPWEHEAAPAALIAAFLNIPARLDRIADARRAA